MATIRFTDNIQRHVDCPTAEVEAATVREALDVYFENGNDKARGYVLDDQGLVRRHMIVFLNGAPVKDRASLGDAVSPSDTIDVMQALSGG